MQLFKSPCVLVSEHNLVMSRLYVRKQKESFCCHECSCRQLQMNTVWCAWLIQSHCLILLCVALQWRIWSTVTSLRYVTCWYAHTCRTSKMLRTACTMRTTGVASWQDWAPTASQHAYPISKWLNLSAPVLVCTCINYYILYQWEINCYIWDYWKRSQRFVLV